MTAYLSPGDKIHLALPADRNLSRAELIEQFAKEWPELKALYMTVGVEVFNFSTHQGLEVPTVVCVIQAERKLM